MRDGEGVVSESGGDGWEMACELAELNVEVGRMRLRQSIGDSETGNDQKARETECFSLPSTSEIASVVESAQ